MEVQENYLKKKLKATFVTDIKKIKANLKSLMCSEKKKVCANQITHDIPKQVPAYQKYALYVLYRLKSYLKKIHETSVEITQKH